MYMSLWFGESDKTLTAVDIHILHLSYARPAHVSGSQHDQTCYPEQVHANPEQEVQRFFLFFLTVGEILLR